MKSSNIFRFQRSTSLQFFW